MKYLKIITIALFLILCSFYIYITIIEYKYYRSGFTDEIFSKDTIVEGGYYRMITELALLSEKGRNSFPPSNVDDIRKKAISSEPGLDFKDYNLAFTNSYLVVSNDNIFILSKGTDKMKSFIGAYDIPEKVSYLEYMLNLKDIELAREYYGIDSYNRWSLKVFINEKAIDDSINYIDRLNTILASERHERFPKGYNYRKFNELGNIPDGFFIGFMPQFNSWRVYWITEKIKEQNINLDTVKLENLLNMIKKDSILIKADSIHFPYYLP
jgi:hypothetical protein